MSSSLWCRYIPSISLRGCSVGPHHSCLTRRNSGQEVCFIVPQWSNSCHRKGISGCWSFFSLYVVISLGAISPIHSSFDRDKYQKFPQTSTKIQLKNLHCPPKSDFPPLLLEPGILLRLAPATHTARFGGEVVGCFPRFPKMLTALTPGKSTKGVKGEDLVKWRKTQKKKEKKEGFYRDDNFFQIQPRNTQRGWSKNSKNRSCCLSPNIVLRGGICFWDLIISDTGFLSSLPATVLLGYSNMASLVSNVILLLIWHMQGCWHDLMASKQNRTDISVYINNNR